MKTKLVLSALAIAASLVQVVPAAVIVNPTLVTGSNAIDPQGRVIAGLTPSNVTSQATLEATDGFGALQNFAGFTAGTNTLSFADISLPDVQFSLSGDLSGTAGAQITNGNYTTSPDGALRFESIANPSPVTTVRTFTLTMTFGDWNGSAFTAATAGSLVAPRTVGFTFVGPGDRTFMFDSVVANFRDLSGGTVITQSLTGLNITNNTTVNAGYFGYQGATQIGSVDLTITTKPMSFGNTPIVGIDDFGFAVVPEPSTVGLVLGGVAALLALGRRRRKN